MLMQCFVPTRWCTQQVMTWIWSLFYINLILKNFKACSQGRFMLSHKHFSVCLLLFFLCSLFCPHPTLKSFMREVVDFGSRFTQRQSRLDERNALK